MTLDDLAAESDVSKRMISAYEKGENDITLSKLRNIAKALKVSVSILIGENSMEDQDDFNKEREKYMWEQIRIKDEEIARLKGLSKEDTKKAM